MTASPRRPGGNAPLVDISEDWPPFLILVCLTLLFLAQTPAIPPIAQLLCVFGGIGGLVATVAVCRGFAENIGRAFWKAPTFLLFLLVSYTTYRYFTTPPIYRLLATTDLLRVYGGVLAYFACAYILGTGRQLGRLVIGIAVFAVFVAFADFSKFSNEGLSGASAQGNNSVLGLHMTVGGFLAMLVPVVAAFAFLPDGDDKQRLASQLVFLVIGFALILARSRSSWVAGVVALLVVGILFGIMALRERWRRGTEAKRPRRNEHPVARILNSPFLWVGLGLIVLVIGGGVSGILSQRGQALQAVMAGKVTTDATATFQARLNTWRAALLMIHEKPRFGFGLGGYMVEQGRWSHVGDETVQVLTYGTGHQNRAHNFYLQWAVDSGLLGLFLHAAFGVAWFVAMLRGFAVAPSPERRALAIGAMGAVIAGAVDAIASPMYQMHGTYALWMAWMGIGLGALRADPPRQGISLAFSKGENTPPAEDHPAIAAPTPILDWLGAGLLGAGSVMFCLFLANRIVTEGAKKPLGTFRIVQVPYVSEIRPGTRIVFKALYKDENGVDRATLPGTQWQVYATDDVVTASEGRLIRMDGVRQSAYGTGNTEQHCGLVLVPPPGTKAAAITVFGIYHDDYGRVYRKAATVAVRDTAPEIVPYKLPGEK